MTSELPNEQPEGEGCKADAAVTATAGPALTPEQLAALISAATAASAAAAAVTASMESVSVALAKLTPRTAEAAKAESAEATAEAEKDSYDYVVAQVSREDGLIHNRMTWTLQLNGFLFAALALLKVVPPGAKATAESLQPWVVDYLLGAIPFTGLVITFSGWAGIWGANWQLWYLTRMYAERVEGAAKKRAWPRPFGSRSGPFFLGTLPNHVSLLVVGTLWAWLALHAILPEEIERYSGELRAWLQTHGRDWIHRLH
ncbi:MAG: hypothetical protein J7549_00525 [Variovorax sp.]|nr:hypothetical protein [Variovorax sp.]